MKKTLSLALVVLLTATAPGDQLERQFRELPMEARRYTGPLFWMHGTEDESPERLRFYLEKVAEGGNGSFTAESRPHIDWLGPGWYRDLGILLEKARELDLHMWIFDERWWPSQSVGGTVPPRYVAKTLVAEPVDLKGPMRYQADGHAGERYIATVAARINAEGDVLGDSLVDLADSVQNGTLSWQVPEGDWRVIRFGHKQAPGLGQRSGRELSVDGASRDCVEWFIETVYQPHYEHFKEDFGTRIRGDVVGPTSEPAARILVNGEEAGGFIGRPFRLDVTEHIQAGKNQITVRPFNPTDVRLLLLDR